MITLERPERTHDSGKRNADHGQASDEHALPQPAVDDEEHHAEHRPYVDPAEEAMSHNPNLSPPIHIHPA